MSEHETIKVRVAVIVFEDGKSFASSGYGDVTAEEDAWEAAASENRYNDELHRVVWIEARVPRPKPIVVEFVIGEVDDGSRAAARELTEITEEMGLYDGE